MYCAWFHAWPRYCVCVCVCNAWRKQAVNGGVSKPAVTMPAVRYAQACSDFICIDLGCVAKRHTPQFSLLAVKLLTRSLSLFRWFQCCSHYVITLQCNYVKAMCRMDIYERSNFAWSELVDRGSSDLCILFLVFTVQAMQRRGVLYQRPLLW